MVRTDLPYGAHRSASWRAQICLMARFLKVIRILHLGKYLTCLLKKY